MAELVTGVRLDRRLSAALAFLAQRVVRPPSYDVSRLSSNNRRLAEQDYRDRLRAARTTTDDPIFAGLALSRRDWRALEDAGLVEITPEVETVYPDPESGVAMERRVDVVRLADRAARTRAAT